MIRADGAFWMVTIVTVMGGVRPVMLVTTSRPAAVVRSPNSG